MFDCGPGCGLEHVGIFLEYQSDTFLFENKILLEAETPRTHTQGAELALTKCQMCVKVKLTY